jgi:hypothetical protein
VIRRTRFACLLPVVVFIALRALSQAHPAPLPWSTGVYDAHGLDDILQGIRSPYARSVDDRHVSPRILTRPTGRVFAPEPSLPVGARLAAPRSRAPPSA